MYRLIILYHSPAATSNTVWLLVNFVIFVILFYIIPQQPHQTLCSCWRILSFLLFCFISFPSSHIKHCVAAGEFCHFYYFVLYHSPAATSNTVWLPGLGPKYSVLRYFGTRVPILQYSSVLSTRTFKKDLYSYLYSSTFKNKSTLTEYLRVLYEY